MIPTGDLADAYAMMQQTNNYKLILPRAAPAAAGAAADAAAVPPGSLLYVNSGRSAAQVGIMRIKKYEQALGGIGMQKSMDEFESECLSLHKVAKELDVSTPRAPCAHRAWRAVLSPRALLKPHARAPRAQRESGCATARAFATQVGARTCAWPSRWTGASTLIPCLPT